MSAVCVIGEPDPAMSILGTAGSPSSPKLSLSVDKVLEKAQVTGILELGGRHLKCFPRNGGQFRLKDTRIAGKDNLPSPLTHPGIDPILFETNRFFSLSTMLPCPVIHLCR